MKLKAFATTAKSDCEAGDNVEEEWGGTEKEESQSGLNAIDTSRRLWYHVYTVREIGNLGHKDTWEREEMLSWNSFY